MRDVTYILDDLNGAAAIRAGGKARVLAQLRQAGFAVPPGIVVLPEAFENGRLSETAWESVQRALDRLRGGQAETTFAVRSSAGDEDGRSASFAGAYESLLDVRGGDALRAAVEAVYQSRFNARVDAYRTVRGAATSDLAVLVQPMIAAEYAGVLFTIDPVTGDGERMAGSVVPGLGDKLVSGEADGEMFFLHRPSGDYEGPDALQSHAETLYGTAVALEETLGGALDIEWATAGDELTILQARPVTTVAPGGGQARERAQRRISPSAAPAGYDPATGIWNDSTRGDYLWSNANFGEAFPDVMTPLTWSQVQMYGEETFDNPLAREHPFFGNIAGRLYANLALFAALMTAFGLSRERLNYEAEPFFGRLPEEMAIPELPLSRWRVMAIFVPYAVRAMVRRARNMRNLAAFTQALPSITARLEREVAQAQDTIELARIWRQQLEPQLRRSYQMLQAGTSQYENAYRPLRRDLLAQVGAEEAYLLLANVSEGGERLASLGPLVALAQVARGEKSREAYIEAYGHRGPHEMELSWPRPAEDGQWLDHQLAALETADVEALLANRASEQTAAWERYRARFPQDAPRVKQKLEQAAAAARAREQIRSEETRLYGVIRQFALRAGDLTGVGEDIFFLWLDELLALLAGEKTVVEQIPVRRAAHARLVSLPPFPALIKGAFDPFTWAADPDRRSDRFGAGVTAASEPAPAADARLVINGYPASAGVAEGPARVLDRSDDGHLLQPGEVLVAATTNVGWTPLFPRAAAVVTDVGAPLSHAAIVARELGIPAVVGTGEATMRLRTGDRVRVDGAAGLVEKLPPRADQ